MDDEGPRLPAKAMSPTQSGTLVSVTEEPYWVFVCNPRKWAIDRFLELRIERDTWGIRKSDGNRFAPGQLGIIRVGVDRRTKTERKGKPPMRARIYALCEVESNVFEGTGANGDFWAPGHAREPGWPTGTIRYLQVYKDNPLTIERMRAEIAEISRNLLNGLEASSFPISANDFHIVMRLLGEDLDHLPIPEQSEVRIDKLAAKESEYLHACPEVEERLSKVIERGPTRSAGKKKNRIQVPTM